MTRRFVGWILVSWLFLACVHANSNSNHNKKPSQLSKKLNKQVEDLYDKAEKLQSRAFQRVYELQAKAQEMQDKAMQRAYELEQQSQTILEKATRQAQELQKEATLNLEELTNTIESLPIPAVSKKDDTVFDATADTSMQVDLGDGLSLEVPVAEVPVISTTTVVVKNKWQNVRERTMPAVVMLGGLAIYVNMGGSFIPLIFLIQFGLYAETTAVCNIQNKQKWWWLVAAIVATNGSFLGWKNADAIAYGMSVVGLVTWVIQQNAAPGAGALVFHKNLASLAATALSLLILVGQSSFWIATLQEYGLTWILYPAFLVIINDTMAYVFGMLMGKHPLLPIISPKKTWEGFIGATLSTLGVSYPLLNKMLSSTSLSQDELWKHALAIGTFVSLVSPFGGFLASLVKRAHGKKDFADWIPGHGGAVDRLDCQVITAPFVYYYLTTCMAKPP